MKYPIGIQDFEKIRTGGYAYVDKTALIYKLANEGNYYFLSCPRRFGKSLLLSTLAKLRFGSYWFETGTPTFIVDLLKRGAFCLPNLTAQEVPGYFLNSIGSVERTVSDGRIDMVAKTKDFIYIFEFKCDQSAEAAIRQIDERDYAKPYASDRRKLVKIGVNFSREKRCIDDWKISEA